MPPRKTSPPARLDRSPVAHSYLRFSSAPQEWGDSTRRQVAASEAWSTKAGIPLSSLTFADKGVSALRGKHRSVEYALGRFLELAKKGDGPVQRGDYLVIENLDRLSREEERTALRLWLDILDAGINIVQLSPETVFRHERSDITDIIRAIIELSRGHSESRMKSERVAAAWGQKKIAARNGQLLTKRLPAWVTLSESGEMVLVPERAQAVRLIFRLAASGYGVKRILGKLNKDGVPPIGKKPTWVRSYITQILIDRRAIGEYQPRKRKNHERDGEPIRGYFPPVVTEEMFFAARAGAAERGKYRGRLAQQLINPFAGLLKNAREGDAYFLARRTERCGGRTERHHVLINYNGEQGIVPRRSFPYLAFEGALLALLRELDPAEVLGKPTGTDEVTALKGELAWVEQRVKDYEDELRGGAPVAAIARLLREQEERKREIEAQLEAARGRAAVPVASALKEMKSLASVVDNAEDQEDVRLRLRSALRRAIESIWMLVTPRGRDRLCAVQIFFRDAGNSRSFLIALKAGRANQHGPKPARWVAKSLADAAALGPLDLRNADHVRRLEAALERLDIRALMAS
jgi:DNA invertase Pin-like site-specific DNA recombinase